MESKLANDAERALIEATQRLSPEERLNSFLAHCRLIMELREAQDRYAAELEDVRLVLSLSTMLHGIGVGNMLPSWVKMVSVDINPAVVTKLADRGSSQTLGIVTDVGLFLHRLAQRLRA